MRKLDLGSVQVYLLDDGTLICPHALAAFVETRGAFRFVPVSQSRHCGRARMRTLSRITSGG